MSKRDIVTDRHEAQSARHRHGAAGWGGVDQCRIIPVAHPRDDRALVIGEAGEGHAGVAVAAVVEPTGVGRVRVRAGSRPPVGGEPDTVEVPDKVLRSRSPGDPPRVEADDQHPSHAVEGTVDGEGEQVGAFPDSADRARGAERREEVPRPEVARSDRSGPVSRRPPRRPSPSTAHRVPPSGTPLDRGSRANPGPEPDCRRTWSRSSRRRGCRRAIAPADGSCDRRSCRSLPAATSPWHRIHSCWRCRRRSSRRRSPRRRRRGSRSRVRSSRRGRGWSHAPSSCSREQCRTGCTGSTGGSGRCGRAGRSDRSASSVLVGSAREALYAGICVVRTLPSVI